MNPSMTKTIAKKKMLPIYAKSLMQLYIDYRIQKDFFLIKSKLSNDTAHLIRFARVINNIVALR